MIQMQMMMSDVIRTIDPGDDDTLEEADEQDTEGGDEPVHQLKNVNPSLRHSQHKTLTKYWTTNKQINTNYKKGELVQLAKL